MLKEPIEVQPRSPKLTRASISSRLCLSFCIIISAWMEWDILRLLILCMIASLLLITANIPRTSFGYLMKFLFYITLATIVAQSIFYYEYYISGRGTVLFVIIKPDNKLVSLLTLGRGIVITLEGITYGIILSLKMCCFIMISYFAHYSIKLNELIDFMRKLRIPWRLIIFIVMIIKFIPIILEDLQRAIKVLKMKGEKLSVTTIHKTIFYLLNNVIHCIISKATDIAIALEIRCFRNVLYVAELNYSKPLSCVLFLISLLVFLMAII